MNFRRHLTLPKLGLVVGCTMLGFGFGQVVDRPNVRTAPLIREIPVVGGKPVYDRVVQDGRVCDLRWQFGKSKHYKKVNETCPVAVGKEFTAGYHKIRDGWKIESRKEGPVFVGTVVNDNPGSIAGLNHTLHLERYDGSLVEILWCETEGFAAGQSRDMTCAALSPEGSRPFDTVAVN